MFVESILRTFSPMLMVSALLAGGTASGEDGYRLWLRYDRIEDAGLRAGYAEVIRGIVAPGDEPTLEALREELQDGLSGLLGKKVPLVSAVSGRGAVAVGTPESSPFIRSLELGPELAALGDDGYLIRSVGPGNVRATVVASRTPVGALYGSYHLLRLLQTRQNISQLDIAEKPLLDRRLLNHWDNPDGSIERGYAGRSLWKWDELPEKIDPRYKDYARANASVGINGAVLNNVNAKPEQLASDRLRKAAALAGALRPYGIRVYLSVNFASPKSLGGLADADPRNPEVRKWWRDKADEIYQMIPDFGGFLVKANSEGQPGPQDYGLSHADGANMLGEALAPHGGIVLWRAFVYNSPKVDKDRAKRAYLEFMPLDGKFRDNVVIQIKTGPVDFQPREPFHPLFGSLRRTSIAAELQITQENMGHSTHLVYLGTMWDEFMHSDTHARGSESEVWKMLAASPVRVISGVANTGSDRNWCGHHFAQANWYAFGRLAWNGDRSAGRIAGEWTRMTWGNDPRVVRTVLGIMKKSWPACVNYEMPMGIHHIMEAGGHYDPKPATVNKAAPEYSAWYYHKADRNGIGFDRTAGGSDAIGQYAPEVARRFGSPETCPDELLLWFHHVGWDHRLANGRSVWEELCWRYHDGVKTVREMAEAWDSLEGRVDAERLKAVARKLEAHVKHAAVWRDTCVTYFQSVNGRPLPAGLPR